MRITLIALLLVNLSFISCAEAQEKKQETKQVQKTEQVAKDVSAEEFKKLITGEGTILDVRTPNEFSTGHLPNAVNINVFDAEFNTLAESNIDKTKPVYVYCKSGGRSSQAMSKLKKMGYTTVYNMLGGYSGWSGKGYPSEK